MILPRAWSKAGQGVCLQLLTSWIPPLVYCPCFLLYFPHALLLSTHHRMRCFLFWMPLLMPKGREPSDRSISSWDLGSLVLKLSCLKNELLRPAHQNGAARRTLCSHAVCHVTVGQSLPKCLIHSSKCDFIMHLQSSK